MILAIFLLSLGISGWSSSVPPKTLYEFEVADVPDWLYTQIRRVHLPPLNMDEVSRMLDYGANVVTANIDWIAWHIGEFTESPRPEAESVLERFITTCHARGARAIGYMGPFTIPARIAEFRSAHPDWMMRNRDGAVVDKLCFQGGYMDILCRQLKYLGEKGLDGIWIDGYNGVSFCYCDGCQRRYRAAYGKPIPYHLDWDNPEAIRYIRWYRQAFLDALTRMRNALREGNPEAVVIANNSVIRDWSQSWLAEYPHEYQFTLDAPSLELWWHNPADALYPSFNIWAMVTIGHGRPANTWIMSRANGIIGKMPVVELKSRYLNTLANGAFPEFVTPTGDPTYAKIILDAIAEREEWLIRAKPVVWAALLVDRNSKMFYANVDPLPRYMESIFGLFRAMSEEHLPLNFITEIDLENDWLDGYQVLILPNAGALSERAFHFVRKFVENGGGLVASGATSAYHHDGRPRGNFALADLFHADYKATLDHTDREERVELLISKRHAITEDPIIEQQKDIEFPLDHPLYGRMSCASMVMDVEVREGGDVLATWCTEREPNIRKPAIIVSTYGKGKVVYFPVNIDQFYYTFSAPYARRLLVNAVQYVAPQPPKVRVKGPLMMRATYLTQPTKQRLIVHLLNDQSSWGQHSASTGGARRGFPPGKEHTWPVREEVIPLRNIEVTIGYPNIRRVHLEPEGKELPMREVPDGWKVIVPELQIHSMVVVELAE